jgi:hypothetical protein
MIALREIMRECYSGILKRHQGEAILVPAYVRPCLQCRLSGLGRVRMM